MQYKSVARKLIQMEEIKFKNEKIIFKNKRITKICFSCKIIGILWSGLLTSKLCSIIIIMQSKFGKKEGGMKMDKEKVLEMSRKENKFKDLMAKGVEKSASEIAGIVAIILSLIFYTVEIATRGRCNWGFFAIIVLYNGVMFTVKGIKKRNWKECVLAALWLIWAALLSTMYIDYLVTLPSV